LIGEEIRGPTANQLGGRPVSFCSIESPSASDMKRETRRITPVDSPFTAIDRFAPSNPGGGSTGPIHTTGPLSRTHNNKLIPVIFTLAAYPAGPRAGQECGVHPF